MRWLLVKDLQILKRSPLLVGLLVVYPIAIALMIGLITTPTAFVYNNANNIRSPYGSRRANTRAAGSGKNPASTRPPSSGSSGSKLKTASSTLIITEACIM